MTPTTHRLLARIARDELGIPNSRTRRSDALDFHTVAVWQVETALAAAYEAAARAPARAPAGCPGQPAPSDAYEIHGVAALRTGRPPAANRYRTGRFQFPEASTATSPARGSMHRQLQDSPTRRRGLCSHHRRALWPGMTTFLTTCSRACALAAYLQRAAHRAGLARSGVHAAPRLPSLRGGTRRQESPARPPPPSVPG